MQLKPIAQQVVVVFGASSGIESVYNHPFALRFVTKFPPQG